jgi:hypothetical protein
MSDPRDIIISLAEFSSDPVGFVFFAFPWGQGELAEWSGPEWWQIDILTQLGEGVISFDEAVQLARTSGHGVGKSALVAWIILWAISTFEDTKGVVTANTEKQLITKTWAELAKWHRIFIGRDFFNLAATGLYAKDPSHERTWRIDMVPWSEKNTEAFAGLHNQGKRIIVIFDEASAISDTIWEVTEGALTDRNTQIIWVCFGNPTRNTGRFRECFPGGKFAHRWKSAAIDSRTVSFTDKKQIQRWVDDYGEDSDFVRVRVRGMFPRIDAVSFIPYDLARDATLREPTGQEGFPIVLGVDVGRFGDDPSVIYPRCGPDGKSRQIEVYYGISTMELAARVAAASLRFGGAIAFVDEGGVGGGVVDRLMMLQIPTVPVNFGALPDGTNVESGTKYKNKRSEIWGALRDWLKTGCIPEKVADHDMVSELTAPSYGMNDREEIQLERKTDMRRRGLASPNIADALACTFAIPVYNQPVNENEEKAKPYVAQDYDPFDRERIYG